MYILYITIVYRYFKPTCLLDLSQSDLDIDSEMCLRRKENFKYVGDY